MIVRDPKREEYLEIALGLTLELDIGEAYVIALRLELSADILLINDQKAKEIAESMGINTKWISEVLLEAVEKKLIKTYDEFKTIFDQLIEKGLWIRKLYYETILSKVKNLVDKNRNK